MNTIELANAIHEAKKVVESRPEDDAVKTITNLLWWLAEFDRELEGERRVCASYLGLIKEGEKKLALATPAASVPAAGEVAGFPGTHPVSQVNVWADAYEKEGGHALIVQMLRAYAGLLSRPPTSQDAAPAAAVGATTFQGPKKWTDEEIAQGYVGIRWVSVEGVAGRPTSHDVMEHLKARGEAAYCDCADCQQFFTTHTTPPPLVQPSTVEVDEGTRPETMEIRYETFGNCLWHTDCKINSLKSGVMQMITHGVESSTMKCLSCGQVGAYPKGRVGTVCVPVISTDAAILASEPATAGRVDK